MILENHYTILHSSVLEYNQGRGIHLDAYQAHWIFIQEKISSDRARDLPAENKNVHRRKRYPPCWASPQDAGEPVWCQMSGGLAPLTYTLYEEIQNV